VSPLAEGGERLVASVARSLIRRVNVLPPEDINAKLILIRATSQATLECRAQPMILDGTQNENESLLEVNRRLLWNCDVLIAIWDGNPHRDRREPATSFSARIAGHSHRTAPRDGNGHHNQLHMFHVLEPTSARTGGHRAAFAG